MPGGYAYYGFLDGLELVPIIDEFQWPFGLSLPRNLKFLAGKTAHMAVVVARKEEATVNARMAACQTLLAAKGMKMVVMPAEAETPTVPSP